MPSEEMINKKIEDQYACCSFCEKHVDEVVKMVKGPNVFICNECVELCYVIVDGDKSNEGLHA